MKESVAPPRDLCVVLYNDNHTPRAFIEKLLEEVFFKNATEINSIIKKAETEGQALLGVYALDVAVSKRRVALYEAKKQGWPVRVEAI